MTQGHWPTKQLLASEEVNSTSPSSGLTIKTSMVLGLNKVSVICH